MVSMSFWITLYSAPGLENLGFSTADVRVWLYNSINNQQMLLGQRYLDLGSSDINQHIPFLLDERTLQLGCLHLVIEIITEASVGRVDIGFVRLPFQRLVRPGWVMPASSQIRSTTQGYPMGVLNVSVYTELPANGPANYPHPPPGPHAPYPNPGYPPVAPANYPHPPPGPHATYHHLGSAPVAPAHYPHPPPGPHAPYPNPRYPPVAPQQYQPPPVFGTIVSHFLGGMFGQIGSGAMNQDMFGDGFSFEDLIASYFM